MFNFRIISCEDGTEVIDQRLKTPYESLTPYELVEYVKVALPCIVFEKKTDCKPISFGS